MMKLVVSGFAALSGFAILALTIFVPKIYWEMNELQVEVVGVVESFKVGLRRDERSREVRVSSFSVSLFS